MTEQQLVELERLANAATPPPWLVKTGIHGTPWILYLDNPYRGLGDFTDYEGMPGPQNAAFVAAAREAVPTLIAEVRRLKEKLRVGLPTLFPETELAEFLRERLVEHRNNAIASRKRAEAAEENVRRLREALRYAQEQVRLGANAGAWWNDPRVFAADRKIGEALGEL